MAERQMNEMLSKSLQNLNLLVDSSKVVGTPVTIDQNRILIPISKISFGFGVGGSEFATEKGKVVVNNLLDSSSEYPFGGGTIGGVNISPIGFIVLDQERYQMIRVEQGDTLFEKLFDLFLAVMKKKKKTEERKR